MPKQTCALSLYCHMVTLATSYMHRTGGLSQQSICFDVSTTMRVLSSKGSQSSSFCKLVGKSWVLYKLCKKDLFEELFFSGDEKDYGVIPTLESQASATCEVDAVKFVAADGNGPQNIGKDPTWEDMIILYPTVPGYVANR